MGKNSEHYKSLRAKQLETLKSVKKSLPQYARSWLDQKILESQPNTAMSYAYDLRTFFGYLKANRPACAKLDPKEIPLSVLESLSPEDINEYQSWLMESEAHSNSQAGAARRMAALRGLYRYLCTRQLVPSDPTLAAAKRRKKPKDAIVHLEPDETKALSEAVRTADLSSDRQRKICGHTVKRDFCLVTLLLSTGIRVSECAGLDTSDVDLAAGTIQIVRKGGKAQALYLNAEAVSALYGYLETERAALAKTMEDGSPDAKALFLSAQKKRMCVKSIENVVKKYAREAVPGKRITPHKLRSTYGTALYAKTGDIRLVADVLGHEDINTTAKHYAAIAEEHRKEAAKVDLYGTDKASEPE